MVIFTELAVPISSKANYETQMKSDFQCVEFQILWLPYKLLNKSQRLNNFEVIKSEKWGAQKNQLINGFTEG